MQYVAAFLGTDCRVVRVDEETRWESVHERRGRLRSGRARVIWGWMLSVCRRHGPHAV